LTDNPESHRRPGQPMPGAAPWVIREFPSTWALKGNGLADCRQLQRANHVPAALVYTDKSVLDDRSSALVADKKDAPGPALLCPENFHALQSFSKCPVIQTVVPLWQDHFSPCGLKREGETSGKFGDAGPESAPPRRAEPREEITGKTPTKIVWFRIFVLLVPPSRNGIVSVTSWLGFSLPHRVSPSQRLHPVYCLYLLRRETVVKTVTPGEEKFHATRAVGLVLAGMIFFCHTAMFLRGGEGACGWRLHRMR
jgi:hypothetical protein